MFLVEGIVLCSYCSFVSYVFSSFVPLLFEGLLALERLFVEGEVVGRVGVERLVAEGLPDRAPLSDELACLVGKKQSWKRR